LPSTFLTAATDFTEITAPQKFGSSPISLVVGTGNNKWKIYSSKYVQSNGDGTIEIDLTAYSGNAQLEIVARTTSSSNTGRYYTISGGNVVLYSSGYDSTGITNSDQTDTFVLKCGYKYTLKCSNGLRFKSFALKATTVAATATMA